MKRSSKKVNKYSLDVWGVALLIVLGLLVISNIANFSKNKEEKPIEEHPAEIDVEPKRPIVVRLSDLGQDLINEDEGSLMITMMINLEVIENEIKAKPDYIILFSSKNINGLHIVYNAMDSTLEGGLPPMKSVPIKLDKDKMHELIYVYKKGAGQSLFFNGLQVANGPYTGSASNLLTGSAVAGGKTTVDYLRNVYGEMRIS